NTGTRSAPPIDADVRAERARTRGNRVCRRPPSIARREIVSSRTLPSQTIPSLAPATSRDGYRRHLPGVMHRHGLSATAWITGIRLVATNRLTDFRLRLALAVL